MTVSVITPTSDRPLALALAERWMARQTRQPDEWIVADGGQRPATCTMAQVHSHVPKPAGVGNFTGNLARALELAGGDVIVCWEDDEWYGATHLEQLLALFQTDTLVAGDDLQRYYNVAARCWRIFEHTGASLCQTAFRREAVPLLLETIRAAATRGSYGVDAAFWNAAPPRRIVRGRINTIVGIKGLPGQVGLGIGHRPTGPLWQPDASLAQLRSWIGDDVLAYAGYHRETHGTA